MSDPASQTGLIIAGDQQVPQNDLIQRARQAASAMLAMGLNEGDSIALILRNDIAFLEAMIGAGLIGVYVAPVNWHATAEEAAHIVSDSGAKLALIHTDLAARFEAGLPRDIAIRLIETPADIAEAYKVEVIPAPAASDWNRWIEAYPLYDGPAAAPRSNIIYTSGTTGHPKGVVREPATGAMAHRVKEIVAYSYGIVTDQPIRTVITGPMYHSVPNVYARHAVMTPDALVILQARFDAEELLRLIDAYRITHLHLVPTMMIRMLRLPETIRKKYDLSSLTHVVHGAAPCPPEVRLAMIDWLGPIIAEYYGASETGPGVVLTREDARHHPDTVGKPTPWTRLEIRREDETLCDIGEAGEIFLKIDDYPRFEYRNRPGLADEMRRGDLVSVGDMGYRDEDGYIHLVARKNDMIISGGVNIYPDDIEAALLALDGVRDAAVFGLPDPEFGERVCAIVATDHDPHAIRAALEGRLASYKIPRRIDCVETLPREDSGKLRKRLLREHLMAP